MTPEEQKLLAIGCGISVAADGGGYWDNPNDLTAYTAAVELNILEKLSAEHDTCALCSLMFDMIEARRLK